MNLLPVISLNADIERLVLGSILIDARYYPQIAAILNPNDFGLEAHRLIYLAMSEMFAGGTPVDLPLLVEMLRNHGMLDRVGGPVYLSQLSDGLPRVINATHYAKLTREQAIRRRLQDLAQNLGQSAVNQEPTNDILTRLYSELSSPTLQDSDRDGSADIHTLHEEWVKLIMCDSRRLLGYPSLDDRLDAQPGELLLLAAKSQVGKTTIALNMINNILERNPNKRVAMCSCETTKGRIYARLMSIASGISQRALAGQWRDGVLVADDLRPYWNRFLGERCGLRYFLGTLTIERVAAEVARMETLWGAPAEYIIIDFLGALGAEKYGNATETEVTTALSFAVQNFAKRSRALVIALVQLNKLSSKTEPVIPNHLRSSGCLYDATDSALGAWRPNADKEGVDDDRLFMSVMKAKDNPTHPGIAFRWQSECLRITELEQTYF